MGLSGMERLYYLLRKIAWNFVLQQFNVENLMNVACIYISLNNKIYLF